MAGLPWQLLLCVSDCSGPRVSHEPLQIVLDALDILRQRNAIIFHLV